MLGQRYGPARRDVGEGRPKRILAFLIPEHDEGTILIIKRILHSLLL
jgi:hypothetical protein